jgi:chemotaxis protein methyltransferase CheR
MAFSFFFRDEVCLSQALQQLVPAVMGRSRIAIWDAGCAMGQEPYTLAIMLAERMGYFAFRNVEIHASDYDAPLLETVRRGIYPKGDLERIPAPYLSRYFQPAPEANTYEIVSKIRDAVKIHMHDLRSLQPFRENFSLVVCKNVLLHFPPAERVDVLKMFHRALEPSGLLIMEQTQKLPDALHGLFQQVAADAQLYRKEPQIS